jgi:hypothetical protein
METIGTFTPDNLYADIGFPEVRETRNIPAGTAVKRGDILGDDFKPIITGGTPDGIALSDIGATDTIRICEVALTGAFNANALFTGDATTPDDWKDDLRKLSIFVRHPAP